MSTPATHDEIVDTFVRIPYQHLTSYNWGTAPPFSGDEWNVNDETYINGVMMTIDHDYWMGYLIEVVERTSSMVKWLAVNTYHGHRKDGSIDNVYATYGVTCAFFHRPAEADGTVICKWAIDKIEEMGRVYFDQTKGAEA